ncbi:hypothetical protein ACFLTZ_04065 [Chloroflexota bacterium]
MNYCDAVVPALLGNIPVLLAWLVGIILAVRMSRRGGGKAEKLLLIGCSLMFVAEIVRPFLRALTIWLIGEHGITTTNALGFAFSLPNAILSMAGIVCLVLAFWTRWKTKAVTQ